VLQCVAVCCSVLQRVAVIRCLPQACTESSASGVVCVYVCVVCVCCSVLQCLSVVCWHAAVFEWCVYVLQRVAACCSVLQYGAVCNAAQGFHFICSSTYVHVYVCVL